MTFKFLVALLISVNAQATPRETHADKVYNSTRAGSISVPTATHITAAEMSYLSGVTSAIQSQINAIGGSRVINSVITTFTIPSLISDYILNADSTGGGFTVTLPDASTAGTFCIDIKNIGSPANNITIDGQGLQTIDSALTFILTDTNEAIRMCPKSGNWLIY